MTKESIASLISYWTSQQLYCQEILQNGIPTDDGNLHESLTEDVRNEIQAYQQIVNSTIECLNELDAEQ